ncbi:unnamed protein product [Darwinula stevensoni]|uniref:SSD domain-containing protein n=1 Tax=Darwinula stevensoni TaxID=69355 RepID=A0A7R8XJ05_9CRUS|nr:unnamed protein product [Darwinula stevensoni]CAG0894338.1 unnamed protein product [Darwinula stevensoni]
MRPDEFLEGTSKAKDRRKRGTDARTDSSEYADYYDYPAEGPSQLESSGVSQEIPSEMLIPDPMTKMEQPDTDIEAMLMADDSDIKADDSGIKADDLDKLPLKNDSSVNDEQGKEEEFQFEGGFPIAPEFPIPSESPKVTISGPTADLAPPSEADPLDPEIDSMDDSYAYEDWFPKQEPEASTEPQTSTTKADVDSSPIPDLALEWTAPEEIPKFEESEHLPTTAETTLKSVAPIVNEQPPLIHEEYDATEAPQEESEIEDLNENPDPTEDSFPFLFSTEKPPKAQEEHVTEPTNPRRVDQVTSSEPPQASKPPSSDGEDDQAESQEPPSSPPSTIGSVGKGGDYEDYGDYGWKASADETPLFGAEKDEENTFFDDRCIYVSTLLLWDVDYDFENITQEEILDKVTNALDQDLDSRNVPSVASSTAPKDVDVILAKVERDQNGRVISAKGIMSVYILKDRTNVTSSKGLRMDLIAEPWEKEFIDLVFSYSVSKPEGLGTYAYAGRSYRDVVGKMIQGNLPLFGFGFIFITIFVALSMGKLNLLQHRILIGLESLLAIGMTIVSATGLCLFLGIPYFELHNIMPFLILGIGIDDTLVIFQSLDNVISAGGTWTPAERVALALKQSGVSITITTLTDIFAFCMGATTVRTVVIAHSAQRRIREFLHCSTVFSKTVPMLRSFCIYTAVGILIIYVMTLLLMVPSMALDEKRKDSNREGCLCIPLSSKYKPAACSQKQFLAVVFDKIVGPALSQTPVKVLVVLATLGLLGINSWEMTKLEKSSDAYWYLGPSYPKDFVMLVENIFPESGARGTFYLGDVDYFREREALEGLARNLSSLELIKSDSIDFWYHRFLQYLTEEGKEYPKTEAEFKDEVSTFLVFRDAGRKYLRDIVYTGNLLVDFDIMVGLSGSRNAELSLVKASRGAYQEITLKTSLEKHQAFVEVREALQNATFKHGDPFRGCYSSGHIHIEANRMVSDELPRNVGLTLVGVFVVILLLVGDLRVSVWVLSCILLTLVGIAGSIQLFGLTLELLTCILIILSVGLAVDYSTHIAHKFMVTHADSKDARVRITLTSIGPPVFNGGFTTMMAFVFCWFSDNYLFTSTLKVRPDLRLGQDP